MSNKQATTLRDALKLLTPKPLLTKEELADFYSAQPNQVRGDDKIAHIKLGLSVADRSLPLEAITDVEKMRESLELVVEHSKVLGKDKTKTSDAMALLEEATNARKDIIEIPLSKHQHIPHDVHIKLSASEIMIMPAPGRGLVAGSSVRTVLELGGVKDVTAKIFSRSKNKLNNARAAIAALKKLKRQ